MKLQFWFLFVVVEVKDDFGFARGQDDLKPVMYLKISKESVP